jgi:arginyl-tRNA synthetase
VTLFSRLSVHIGTALDTLVAKGALPAGLDRAAISVEPPRDPAHGDVATNAAMVLAKPAGMNPRALADLLVAELAALGEVTEASVAGPGFINLRLADGSWRDELALIHTEAEDYGRSTLGQGRRVNVEYVSANPTGPMHMGHCRGAVVGDALAALLEFAGHDVIREYYVNDAGGQVDVLARSAHLRYREALGEAIGAIPEGLYPGDYLVPVGGQAGGRIWRPLRRAPEGAWLGLFRAEAVAAMMDMIRADLAKLGIHHDLFSSEAELQAAGKPADAEKWLRAHDLVYDGVLEAPKGETPEDWEPVELPLFRSTKFGDDQDRPIKKSDGSWTYFGADLAYHFQKSQTADQLIDIWGADHAGTVKRIKAAVAALTEGKTKFDVKLVQMVRLLRGGEPVKMSKRAGNFVTLADVVARSARTSVRFTMLTRRSDAQMDVRFRQGGRSVKGQSGLLRPICPRPDWPMESGRLSAPKNDGAKTFEGEGDASFSASEGAEPAGKVDPTRMPEEPAVTPQEREAAKAAADKAAVAKAKPKPAPVKAARKVVAAPAKAPAAAPKAAPAPAAAGSAMIQLGAFSSDAAAAKAWTNLSKRFAYLADLNKSVSPAKVGDGTVYRLRVSAGTAANAANLCGKLRVAGENCVVVR